MKILNSILLLLYILFYEIPISFINNAKNKPRDKYLKELLSKNHLEKEEKCLMICEYFQCNNIELYNIHDILNYENKEYTLIGFKNGARVTTEGLCVWKGNIKKYIIIPNTGDMNGGIERRFNI